LETYCPKSTGTLWRVLKQTVIFQSQCGGKNKERRSWIYPVLKCFLPNYKINC
ncbi:Diadenosine tetraphosphate (Ap4A) hydrolase and other HIT family hydrolases, partial [uncultured Gammaproteobacteria bacterium]